ncbi:DNA polymerase III beta subunit-like protein [Zhihengliuella halotolerans]|uniref:DNA polymerase III beta subunit-like protein n=2 Tax=Zhihengliuella halotolerans TaxID=370736 RepID=A0A4Q8ADE5_9MICC|nr:DNA polymerase III beta subunit-like protein [Zhihengliuella halotolerans]
MPIGAFAKRVGLTTSALRFYDDADVLRPELVDPLTSYRFYGESQVLPASQLRQLREIGMPLSTIGRFFTVSTTEAALLIDQQMAKASAEAASVQRTAEMLKASLVADPGIVIGALSGPVIAAAIDEVLASTVHDPEAPALAGIRLEADPGSISLTTTDRYRLATRTLVPSKASSVSWSGTLVGEDVQATLSWLRRSPTVTLEVSELSFYFRAEDGVAHCRLHTEIFPDYRLLLGSLPEVTHRLTIERRQVLKALEHAPATIGLRISGGRSSLLLSGTDMALNGTAKGLDVTVWFELTTLFPALRHALGNDVLIDLRGTYQPATIRSADDGDLTTLVMPCRAGLPDRTTPTA